MCRTFSVVDSTLEGWNKDLLLVSSAALEGWVKEILCLLTCFLLVMEILSGLISRAKDGSFIKGFRVKERNDAGVEVSICSLLMILSLFFYTSKENLEYLS